MSTVSFSDFAQTLSGIPCGLAVTRKGLRGTGAGSTIFQMTAGTSTHAGDVPTTAPNTNQLYLMCIGSQSGSELSCFTLQGTNQGHLYNGIRLIGISNGIFRGLKLLGAAPGNNYFPPGETFGINDQNGSNNTFEETEIDGRADATTNPGTGATAFGQNSCTGGTFRDCNGHHCPYSAAFALWQGGGTVNLFNCKGSFNRTHLNLERMGQEATGGAACTINVYDFEFGRYDLNDLAPGGLGFGQDILLGNDRGSTKLNIYRPIITPNRFPATGGRDPNKIFVYWPTTEQGGTNRQLQSDVKVFDENGADVSASMLQWSR